MKVIGKDKIEKYGKKHNRARKPLADWLKKTEAGKWKKSADVMATFRTVDNPKDNLYIFNIKGNHHRLVAIIVIKNETVIISKIMPHDEYDKKIKNLNRRQKQQPKKSE